MIWIIAIGVVFFLLLIWFISVYNRFQSLVNGAEAVTGQIRVALKKRLDMITQLYQSVKSYAKFERSTLQEITRMRSNVLNSNIEDIKNIDAQSRSFLSRLLVTVENYPQLKTSGTVKEIMNTVKSVEDEISRLRYTYNNIIQEYNTKLSIFPSNIIASMLGFKKKPYLEFEEDINKTPNLEW